MGHHYTICASDLIFYWPKFFFRAMYMYQLFIAQWTPAQITAKNFPVH